MQIQDPIFIIGSYRGGTSLLFRLLSESKELWSMYRESNHLWQSYHRDVKEKSDTVYLEEKSDGSFLNKNTGELITDLESKRSELDLGYHFSTYNSYILGYLGRIKFIRESFSFILSIINFINYFIKTFAVADYRIVDKTPPNIFRINYLAKLYPDAKFIYLTRDANENISSLVSAWCHKSKFKYPYRAYLGGNLELKDCMSKVWKFYIPEDFSEDKYYCKGVEEVCSKQWLMAHEAAQKAFSKMNKEKYLQVKFEDLLSNPEVIMQELCDFAEIEYSPRLQKIIKEMPAVNTDSKSKKPKAKLIRDPEVQAMQARLGYNHSSYVA